MAKWWRAFISAAFVAYYKLRYLFGWNMTPDIHFKMEENSFQYTAPSNISTRYFPNNKANKYQVKLPHPITLSGEWEVCILDIQYHTPWLTLEQPLYFLLWMQTEDDKIFNLLNNEAAASTDYYLYRKQSAVPAKEVRWSKDTYKPFNVQDRLQTIIALPAGNYDSISDCVSSLNHEILMFWSKRLWPAKLPKHKDIDLTYHYNSTTNQLSVSHIGFKAIQLVSTEPSILSKLGFHYIKTHQHTAQNGNDKDRPYYVFHGTKAGAPKLQTSNINNFMYIHSNLIQHQNIGHNKSQLLGIVPIQAAHRGQSYWKCDPPFYLPLKSSELDAIDIKIENEKGEPFPFTPNTNVIIRLHFRRASRPI